MSDALTDINRDRENQQLQDNLDEFIEQHFFKHRADGSLWIQTAALPLLLEKLLALSIRPRGYFSGSGLNLAWKICNILFSVEAYNQESRQQAYERYQELKGGKG